MRRPIGARRVRAILWKRLTPTDANALLDIQPQSGTGGGAKHIPLRRALPIRDFLDNPTPTGGSAEEPEYVVRIENPGGDPQDIAIEFEVRGAQERHEWRIPRQNSDETRVKAWIPGRKLPPGRDALPGNYILLIRLGDGSIHARAATEEEIRRMPGVIRDAILGEEQGVILL